MRLVRGGEDTFLELKVKLSNSERIAQEIVALANTGGGTIVFGVNDQLRVEGIEDGENVQDELVRICREEIVPPLVPFIDRIAFDNGRRIVALDVNGKRPYRTRDGRFFMRIGADKHEATPEELAAYWTMRGRLITKACRRRGDDCRHRRGALWSFMRGFEGGAFDESQCQRLSHRREYSKPSPDAGHDQRDEIVPDRAGPVMFGHDESVARLLPRPPRSRPDSVATQSGADDRAR